MSMLSAVLSTRIRKIWEYVPCMDCTGQENGSELIQMAKIETKNTIEGYFGSEFPAICNHWGVLVAWSCKTLIKNFETFLFFLEKRPLTVKFLKFCFESFHPTLNDTLCSNFMKFGWREICEIVRCLPDKKKQNFAWLSSCRYCADRARNLPGPALDSVLKSAPDVIQISSFSAKL